MRFECFSDDFFLGSFFRVGGGGGRWGALQSWKKE
jgi:hypothetical protein